MKSRAKKIDPTNNPPPFVCAAEDEDVGVSPLTGAIALTGFVFAAELLGGWYSGSLALMADATHIAVDLLGLSVSLLAAIMARRPADLRRTYGYRRVEVLAALANAIALMFATGFILREAWARWQFPNPIAPVPMMIVAGIGLTSNLINALMLWRRSRGNINIRAAFLHALADAAGSFGALLAGFIILRTRWYEADAFLSALICGGIILTALWLLRDAVHILMEGAPSHLNLEDVRASLSEIDGVLGVHDLHLWSVTKGQEAMSGHLAMRPDADSRSILKEGRKRLEERFGLKHVTLQVEVPEDVS